MAVITCEALTKTFKDVAILTDITFTVEEGARFGILGSEGAGKTTLLQLMTGLLKPTSGSCSLFDIDVSKDPYKALQNAGCLVGEPGLYPHFTAQKNIQLFADLLQADPDETCESVGITFEDAKVMDLPYSKRKQLGIAIALMGDPPLIVLDQPLTGLNTSAKTHTRSLLQSLPEETTLFFTTDYPQNIKDMASEAVILEKGEIADEGPVKSLDLDHIKEVNP